MSRHRDVRNLDYDEEYDEAYDDAVYGHSVDDHEYGVSPNTEQYLYSQRDANYGFGAYFPGSEKIEEEDFEEEFPSEHKRRDSSNYERPRLSSEDEVRLNSVLDEVRNVVGDQFSEADLVREILDNKYDFESSLNAVLTLPNTCGSSSIQSIGYQAAAQLPRTPKRDQPLRTQDETSKFSHFSFMLPLSYCFSSAFVLEKGHYERLPITKYVKEWKQMLRKISKDEKEKSSLKEYDNVKKIIPLSDHEKKFLVELNGLSLDQIDSQSVLDVATSYGSFCKNEVNKPTLIRTSTTDSENCSGVIGDMSPVHASLNSNSLAFKECPSSLKTSLNTDNCQSSAIHQSSFANGLINSLASSPPPGFNVLNSSIGSFSKKCEKIPGNFPNLDSQPKLSNLASIHLNKINSFDESIHKTNPIGHIPPLGNKTSLSALASAHLCSQQPIKDYFAIPALTSTSRINNVPPLQSNPKLALNYTIPAFTAVNKAETVIPQFNMHQSHNIVPSLNYTIPTLHATLMPEKNLNHNPQANLDPSLKMELEASKKFPFQSIECRSKVEMYSDDVLSPSIDLNIALNKKKIYDSKTTLSNVVMDTKKLEIELMPDLTFAERRYLRRNPWSCFGKVILRGRRSCRRKFLIRRHLFLPYRPFDFSSPSPDDVVRKTFEKNVPKYC